MKFSIGEFSIITKLSIKSLRLYHDKGLLIPVEIDDFTGYRYYDSNNFETARIIKLLKSYEFSLKDIKEILDSCQESEDLIEHLKEKLLDIKTKISQYRKISRAIETTIQYERENTMTNQTSFEIEEKQLDTILIAGYRMKGRYDEVGKGFSILGKKFGRYINGKPITLYFDSEYKEEGADYETCFPIRKGQSSEDIDVRELPGGKCVSLIHKGPWDKLSESYKRIMSYVKEKGYKTIIPSREIYLKGPGMIFKGNPKNYLTEIQLLIESE